jgi:hypothetical protein
MKLSLIVLLICIAIIGLVKMLGMLNASPIILFLIAFGIAMIVIFAGFIVFSKKNKS